jgi:uncharacterized protein with PIN domain
MRVRFLADSNVGRLARWLRALGYDAAYEPHVEDGALVRRALAEGRILLTRDLDLTQRRVIASGQLKAILLKDDRVREQLRQVAQDVGLDAGQALSRCLECNLELEARTPADVADRVPPYVRMTQDRYSECPRCGRIYWAGTHWARMREVLASL